MMTSLVFTHIHDSPSKSITFQDLILKLIIQIPNDKGELMFRTFADAYDTVRYTQNHGKFC